MYQNYSSLAKDCMRLRKAEADMFENYISACQEKEKAQVDCKLEISNQKMKIKLLQETLAKRNDEFDSAQKANKQLVSSWLTVAR